MEIKLSVIIPMYNVEDLLDNCLESIIQNKVERMELILINDGSTDNTFQKAQVFQQKYPNLIKLYTQENKGQSSARNLGLKNAKGKYISFIDSDDFIDNNMYKDLINLAEKYKLEIIQCNYMNWYDDSEKNYNYEFRGDKNKIYSGIDYFEYNPSLSPCDKLYLKAFLDEIGFSFKEGYFAEDVLALSKLFYYANRVMYVDRVYYYYRIDSGESTRNSKDINKVIKLGKDKIFVANQLNNFKNKNHWVGSVNKVILRNLIGSFFYKEMKIKDYRNAIVEEFKNNHGFKILFSNFKIKDIWFYLKIGINGLLFNRKI